MISSVSFEANPSGSGTPGGGSVPITTVANNNTAVQTGASVTQRHPPLTTNTHYGANVYQSASPIPCCYDYAPICYYPQQIFQSVTGGSHGGQMFDLPAAYLAAVAATGNPTQSFPPQPLQQAQQIPIPTLAQQQAFLAMQEAATFDSTTAVPAPASTGIVTTSQQPTVAHKRRFSSPSAEDHFTSPVSLDGQVALPASAPPIYGNSNGISANQNGALPPVLRTEEMAAAHDAVIMQPQPHYHYPDQTSCILCTTEVQHQQQQQQQQQQQLLYAATAADNYYQQTAPTQQQHQFYNAQQQRAGLPPMYDGGGYWSKPSSLISAPVSPQQTQQHQLWRLQNAAAALGVGAPVLVDGDVTGSPVHSRFWSPRSSQYTPPPAQHLNRFRAEQEALLAQDVATGASYQSAFDLQQHQLAQALQGLNLFGNFGGGSTTGGAGSVHSDRTYSPHQPFQSQEALWSSSSHLNYPSQTTSPFPTAQFYAMQHGGKQGHHQQQQQLAQMPPEFDPEDLARYCPGINPLELDPSLFWRSRYFVIKSNSTRNVVLSVQHGVWCSTPAGNECLNKAFLSLQQPPPRPQHSSEIGNGVSDGGVDGSIWAANDSQQPQTENSTVAAASMINPSVPPPPIGRVLLFFSVNSSGCFCGVAEMTSPVNKLKQLTIWQDSRWRGAFSVRWLYVKNVPNRLLRHILVESLENRAVTHLRDTNEIVPASNGEELLRIIHKF